MQNVGRWALGVVLLGALAVAPPPAAAESLEVLVPGVMLTDAEIDPYYGKGVEGIDQDITGDGTGTIVFEGAQNNVDDFESVVTAGAGGEQGFVIVTQVSGDGAKVNNFITIDVNINGVEIGAPIHAAELTGVTFNQTADGNQIDITASADVESLITSGTFNP